MAKVTRGRRRTASRNGRATPYPIHNVSEDLNETKSSTPKKDLEDVTCSVCMEYPHNAVLLLCSSHDKGCRPYMCGTSSRYSNCLDQYKKAYTKEVSPHHAANDSSVVEPVSGWPVEKCGELAELPCPLCRGQVKGWTVVQSAREYLNDKKRTCMHDGCSFVGVYKELKKHVRLEHPCAKPREVDPDQERNWRRLEREREREDVISTVTSSMPGSVVFGDYVIERNPRGLDSDDEEGFDVNALGQGGDGGFDVGIDGGLVNVFLLFHAFGPGGNMGRFARRGGERPNSDAFGPGGNMGRFARRGGERPNSDDDGDGGGGTDGDGVGNGMSLVNRLRRQGRVLLGRSGRRRRHREVNGSQT